MTPLVMSVYGTRPEAIKVAPLVRAMAASDRLSTTTVVTGQHREMLDEVNRVFGIVPDHDLDLMVHGQTLAQLAGRVLDGLDPLLEKVAPDAVVVQGDTTTSTAAALAAFYRRIPVVHLEAGLRSHDLGSPFPEEANRRITSRIASLHLAPTATSRRNLLADGVPDASIVVTGNTVIDALRHTAETGPPARGPLVDRLAGAGRVMAVTVHRRESWGTTMHGVGRAVARLARSEPDLTVVLPLHRNPVVRGAVLPHVRGLDNVVVTEPLDHATFAHVLRRCHLVLTDSGGVQEEAPSLGTPVLVMRDTTERPEGVEAGTVRLIGTAEDRIVAEVRRLLHDDAHHRAMARAVQPYGDGRAAERCVEAISDFLAAQPRDRG
jgi:UDP-N-acetylglucosamine 2-epimerase (non-hydrolysing)